MSLLLILLQIITGLGIYNVWLVRSGRRTEYRGKNAPTLKQEFIEYGLPSWSVYVIGTIKLAAATGLIIGIWIPGLVLISAVVLAVMMLGAVSMHVKVHDSLKQTLPALGMLALSVAIIVLVSYI